MYAEFFKAMGWTQVGALAEGGQELPEYHLQLQEYLQEQGVSVLVKRKLVRNPEQLDLSVVSRLYVLSVICNCSFQQRGDLY